MKIIDVFSIDSLSYQVAFEMKKTASSAIDIADVLSLLCTIISEGRLIIEDIVVKLHDNSKKIFELHEQAETSIEVEIDRSYVLQPSAIWSPFVEKTMKGSMQRVIFQDKTICLNGEVMPNAPHGADMSTYFIQSTSIQSPALKAVLSPSLGSKPESSPDRRQSLLAARPSTGLRRQLDQSTQSSTGLVSTKEPDFVPLPPIMHAESSMSRTLMKALANSPFKQKHILSVSQFTRQDLHVLFTVAEEMHLGVQRQGVLDILKGRVLCTMFYELSTRTFASFDAAMQRLGGRIVVIATFHFSTQKGESLEDIIRTLDCYGDAVVLRHPDESSADTAGKCSAVPIINGGNGTREHPTQAFLNLFTIRTELGTITRRIITFVGDLSNDRTVHSLIKLLQHYEGVRVQLIFPPSLALPADVRQQLICSGQLVLEGHELIKKVVGRSDVLYCTRVQKERFASEVE